MVGRWKLFFGVRLLGALAVFFQGVQGYKRVNGFSKSPPNIESKESESEIWIDRLTTTSTQLDTKILLFLIHWRLQNLSRKILVFFLQIGEAFGPLWCGEIFGPATYEKNMGAFEVKFGQVFGQFFPGFFWFSKVVFVLHSFWCLPRFEWRTTFLRSHFFFVCFLGTFWGWHLDKSPVTFCLIGCNRKWKLGISVSLKMWSWSRFFIAKVFNTPYFNRILVWFGMMLGMKSELMSFGTNLQHPVI